MEVLEEVKVTVRKETRLSGGTIARIETELKALGFKMPTEPTNCGKRSYGDNDRAIEELVRRIVSIAPLQLAEMLESQR